jgi:hypothetical protein
MPTRAQLANRFAGLFRDEAARQRLAGLRKKHVTVPTFCLTTSSLRHIQQWVRRLEDIERGQVRAHGNFFTDPAGIGLVDNSVQPAVLTTAGIDFLSFKPVFQNSPEKEEYQLVKTLYFENHRHSVEAGGLLRDKREHLLSVLNQFENRRQEFTSNPKLLVVTELIGGFPGAVTAFHALPAEYLSAYAGFNEDEFAQLCDGPGFLPGLSFLCARIGREFSRAQERRLHQVVSMALLTIAKMIPEGGTGSLKVPTPYSNLVSEKDLFDVHEKYTTDLSIWSDGIGYQVSNSIHFTAPADGIIIHGASVLPLNQPPEGLGMVGARDPRRSKRRGTDKPSTTLIINPLLSEAAEDYVESTVLVPRHGDSLVRVGHRQGEVLGLDDGNVPGADFYVVDADDTPVEFIEVKCISGNLPTTVSLTRAEYIRAHRCADRNIPYRLILFDEKTNEFYEIENFAAQIFNIRIEELVQFSLKITAVN